MYGVQFYANKCEALWWVSRPNGTSINVHMTTKVFLAATGISLKDDTMSGLQRYLWGHSFWILCLALATDWYVTVICFQSMPILIELVRIVLEFSLVPHRLVKEQAPEMVRVWRDAPNIGAASLSRAFCLQSVDIVWLKEGMCGLHEWEVPTKTGPDNLVKTPQVNFFQ